MMKKGKGYPEHVKDTGKTFGDAYAQDITGGRTTRSALNEWPKETWETPKPIKSSRKSTMYI
jgi:hypothetical protein|tara:strand:- start:482 stop:667 length:186 start_codon:yes stop_codon:yes gene_type:complete